MAVSQGYVDYVLEQLEGLGDVSGRRMFGGYGIYCDGLFFALIADDVLYLKVDDTNRPDFEARGLQPFRPYPDKPDTMQYYPVDSEVLEDRERLHAWAGRSLDVARRAKAKRSGKPRPPRKARS